jgi:hypothetical protein
LVKFTGQSLAKCLKKQNKNLRSGTTPGVYSEKRGIIYEETGKEVHSV